MKNHPASVRAHLLNLARAERVEFQQVRDRAATREPVLPQQILEFGVTAASGHLWGTGDVHEFLLGDGGLSGLRNRNALLMIGMSTSDSDTPLGLPTALRAAPRVAAVWSWIVDCLRPVTASC